MRPAVLLLYRLLQAYDELTAKLRELDALNGISGLLGWDELVSRPAAAAGAPVVSHFAALSLRRMPSASPQHGGSRRQL
jgi:hypothetical protein